MLPWCKMAGINYYTIWQCYYNNVTYLLRKHKSFLHCKKRKERHEFFLFYLCKRSFF